MKRVVVLNSPIAESRGESLYPSQWDDLVASWAAVEGAGSTLLDFSGLRNHGTFGATTSAPSWTFGLSGKAVSFDGAGDHVNGGISPLYKVSATAMSFMCWAYIDTSTFNATYKHIIDTATDDPNTNSGFYVAVDDRGGGSSPVNGIQFVIKTASGGFEGVKTSNNVFTSVAWYHIACTLGSGVGHIYINGVESSVVYRNGSGNFVPRNANAFLGTTNNGTGSPFTGVLDDVRLYRRELLQREIVSIYKSRPKSLLIVRPSKRAVAETVINRRRRLLLGSVA